MKMVERENYYYWLGVEEMSREIEINFVRLFKFLGVSE